MKVCKVSESDKSDILEFSQKYPANPALARSEVRRFLSDLISSHSLIFDLHDDQGRMASAVLLDKISNPSNDANLELLGIRDETKMEVVLAQLLGLSQKCCPVGKLGIQVSLPEGSSIDDKFMHTHGLQKFYSTYEMKNASVSEKPIQYSDRIHLASQDSSRLVFELLCRSFQENKETSIPDFETWRAGFLRSKRSRYYLWKEQSEPVGFANLVELDASDGMEVRTIGVLPTHRGAGIGQELLQYCLNETRKLGYKTCYLTVAVENEAALGLYIRSGFEIQERYDCYRVERGSSRS